MGLSKNEIDKVFKKIIDFSGVEKFIDTPVKRYSSGMVVRLAFSVSAHLEPDILLVDEVLAVGDIAFQQKALDKMSEKYTGDKTIFFVSHQLAMVEKLCNKCLLIEDGELIMEGDTNEVIEKYLSSFNVSSSAVLKNIKNRVGDKSIEATKITLNSDGAMIASGDTLKVDVHYKSNIEDIKKHNCFMYLSFKNNLSMQLFQISTKLINFKETDWLQEGIISFKIPKLNLIGGIYHIDLMITVDNKNSDWIKYALSFQVESSDYYNSGNLPAPKHGNFLTKFSVENL